MRKNKELAFHIQSPCTADWNSMTITNKGRHCLHCSKQVYDATNLTPQEIFFIIQRQQGNACMRMRSDLLDTGITFSSPRWYEPIRRYYTKAALIIGMQFLFFNKVQAQIQTTASPNKNSDGSEKKFNKSVNVSGIIADKKNRMPIPNATVSIRENGKFITMGFVDENGFYTIDLKDSGELNKPLSIAFYSEDYIEMNIESVRLNKAKMVFDTVYLEKDSSSDKQHYTVGLMIIMPNVNISAIPTKRVFKNPELSRLLRY